MTDHPTSLKYNAVKLSESDPFKILNSWEVQQRRINAYLGVIGNFIGIQIEKSTGFSYARHQNFNTLGRSQYYFKASHSPIERFISEGDGPRFRTGDIEVVNPLNPELNSRLEKLFGILKEIETGECLNSGQEVDPQFEFKGRQSLLKYWDFSKIPTAFTFSYIN